MHTAFVPRNRRQPNAAACRFELLPQVILPTAPELAEFGVADRNLLRQVLHDRIEYVDAPLFRDPEAIETLFRPALIEDDADAARQAGSYETSYFLKYNYARMRQLQILRDCSGTHLPVKTLKELLFWARQATEVRNRLIEANTPLVATMLRCNCLAGLDRNQLLSEGSSALLRSIDEFDCSQGYQFSTYACRAILKRFSRLVSRGAQNGSPALVMTGG